MKFSLFSLELFLRSLLPVLVLSACTVGPDYKRPEVGVSKNNVSYTRADDKLTGVSLREKEGVDTMWWHVYGNDDLNKLIDIALKNNPNIETAEANLKAAQANVRAQQGFYFPTIQAGYTGQRVSPGATLPSNNNSVNPPDIYSLHTAQLSIGFVPDVFGANKRAVESTKALEKSAQYQLEALKITVITNVISLVTQEAGLAEQYRVLNDYVAKGQTILEHQRVMFEKGYLSRSDYAMQEVALANAQQTEIATKKALDQTRDMLAVLCGYYPSEQIIRIELSNLKIPTELPKVVSSELINLRPDVRAAEELVRSANAQIGVAYGNMLPQLSLGAAIGGAAGAVSGIFDAASAFWLTTFGATQTLFAGGTLNARKDAAKYAAQASVAQYKNTVLTAFQGVADTLYALDADAKNLGYTKRIEESNGVMDRAAQLQLKTGYLSEPNQLLVNQAYLISMTQRIQAQVNYICDTAAFYQVLGGGWVEKTSN